MAMALVRSRTLAVVIGALILALLGLRLAADQKPETHDTETFPPHPRLYLTAHKLRELKQRMQDDDPSVKRWRRWVSAKPSAASIQDLALMFKLTGEPEYREHALKKLSGLLDTVQPPRQSQSSYDFMDAWEDKFVDPIAIGYDWLYDELPEAMRERCRSTLMTAGNRVLDFIDDRDWTPYANYLLRGMWNLGVIGIATHERGSSESRHFMNAAYRIYTEKLLPTMRPQGPGNAWFGGGPPEGTGYGTLDVYRIVDYVLLLKDATGRDLVRDNPFFQDALSYLMHSIYPTDYKAKQFMSGDFKVENYKESGRRRDGLDNKTFIRQTMLRLMDAIGTTADLSKRAASYLRDPALGLDAARYDDESLVDVLYVAANQPASPHEVLAPFYYAPGTGTVFMRSDWSAGATWAAFQAGDKFAYHQHNEQGSFQISKYGQLAIKSGNYAYGSPRSDIMNNYVIRTVAANSLLIHDPGETFKRIRGNDRYTNDGGQRGYDSVSAEPRDLAYWRKNSSAYNTADISVAANTNDYAWVRADLTQAYSSKVKKVMRDFIFLRDPGNDEYFLVFDRVRAANPAFAKRWVLHTQNAPRVTNALYADAARAESLFWRAAAQTPGHVVTTTGDIAIADDLSGRLFCRTLLPERHTITAIGGKGYEAFSAGIAYPIPESAYPQGPWRIEVEPAVAAATDYFLHVLHPARDSVQTMPPATLLAEGQFTGAFLDGKPSARVVLFHRDVDAKAISKTMSVSYTVPTRSATRHLVLDLPPRARYRLAVTDTGDARRVMLTPKPDGNVEANTSGAASFHVPASVAGGGDADQPSLPKAGLRFP